MLRVYTKNILMLYVYMSHINIELVYMVKNKFKFILIFLIVLIILLSSNFQAKNTVKIENEEEPTCIGKFEGRVGCSHSLFYWQSYLFTKADAEVKQIRNGLFGWYHMFLPINKEYRITGYKSGFKPMTKVIYHSEDYTVQELNFDFFESEPENIRSIEYTKPLCYGLIFGRTGGVFEYASWPVGFTKLEFENRSKVSGFFGFYIIGYLEIDKIYKITASKEGYIDETKIVKLTTKNPVKWINFYMHQDF